MYCLSIDWLTIYGSIGVSPGSDGRLPSAGRFTLDYSNDRRSMYFTHACTVRLNGVMVGVMCHEPTTRFMRPATISFKLDNALLYTDRWYDVLLDFLIDYDVRFVTVTRIDFALDFDRLSQYEWSGAEIAQRFVDGRLLRCGSRKYRVIGTGKMHLTPEGSIESKPGGIESVTFGTHNSVCQFQLYNKSLELKQHSLGDYCPKRYISDRWVRAGLDVSSDVWRIELRLKSTAKTLVNHLTGEIEPLSLLSLAPDHIGDTTRAVFAKWCRIYNADVATSSSITHIDRLPRLQILDVGPVMFYTVKAERAELPHARYIKGVLTTLQYFAEHCQRYLADECDAYIIGDTTRAVTSIYSYAVAELRTRESLRIRSENAQALLALLEFKAKLSPYEEHLYSYLKVTQQI